MRKRYIVARACGLPAIEAVRYAVHRRLALHISGDNINGITARVA